MHLLGEGQRKLGYFFWEGGGVCRWFPKVDPVLLVPVWAKAPVDI